MGYVRRWRALMVSRATPLLMAVALCAAPAVAQDSPAPAPTPQAASSTPIVVTGQVTQAAPAPDPSPASASNAPIVVTGKAEEATPPRKEVYDQALKVSRLNPHKLYTRPSPRFSAPLCPGVFGLKPAAAAILSDRIRANAAQLKLPIAKGNCSPNLVVGIFDDSRALLTDLERNQPRLFQLVDASEQKELLDDPSPVRVWNNIRMIGPYGPVPIWHGKEDVPSLSGYTAMFLPMRLEIVSALVVFERDAVIGLTLAQLADYATMRGLSHSRPADGDEKMPTILALFANGGGSPDQLTSFDVGYLRSLYYDRAESRAVGNLLGVQRLEPHQAPAVIKR